MNRFKLKVCGMKEPDNLRGLVALQPDFLGLIFHEKSKRYAGGLTKEQAAIIPGTIKRVGVFVNATLGTIRERMKTYRLDYVQVHGDEDVAFVSELKQSGVGIIKVFRIADKLPDTMEIYEGLADYFLFDTQTKEYGGSGKHFDWSILEKYPLKTPFLLSGGISLKDIAAIKKMGLKGLAGIDVNSRFELEPGKKDLDMIKELTTRL